MAKTLTVNIHIDGGRQTLAAFRKLPKDASDELRDAALNLSKSLATKVSAAARAEGGQAALVAPTVRANRDRVPSITAGGTKRVGRHRKPAGRLVFASEFGMNKRSGWYAAARYAGSVGRQYKPHVGQGSYWFFRTVEENQAEVSQGWKRAADNIIDKWAGAADG